jgi:hypothetical protein
MCKMHSNNVNAYCYDKYIRIFVEMLMPFLTVLGDKNPGSGNE